MRGIIPAAQGRCERELRGGVRVDNAGASGAFFSGLRYVLPYPSWNKTGAPGVAFRMLGRGHGSRQVPCRQQRMVQPCLGHWRNISCFSRDWFC